jgi:integrase
MAFKIKTRTTGNGENRYDVRYRDAAGKVHTETFTRLEDARGRQRTVEADVMRGDWIDPAKGKVTFAEWWAKWWPTTVNLRPSSRARDESYARNHLLPHFGPYPLAAITHTDVVEWVARLQASGLAPATVVKAAQILSKTMTAAVNAEMIRANPCAKVDLPKIERSEMLFLTPGQVSTLADTIDQRYRALVYVGAYCGLRLGELAGLKRARVDLLHRRIEVLEIATEVRGHIHTGPPKTRAGRRSVPLPRAVVAELDAHLADLAGDLVFPSPQGDTMRASLFRRRIWQPATERAGVPGLRIHDLRHTAVAFWIAAGASPKEVAGRAGHSSVVTVFDRYGHLLPGHEDQVTDALDAMAEMARSTPSGTVRAMGAR